MAQENRATIKTYFETGDVPTEQEFANSFDSQVFWQDDVETDLTSNSDNKVPTVKAVKDAIDNIPIGGLPPIADSYADQAAMIADQGSQTAQYIYFDGVDYWEYLGTTIGTIADYRQVSERLTAYVRDANDNVFYRGVTVTMVFGTYNVFMQNTNGNTLGSGIRSCVFEPDAGGFTFGDSLQRVTIKTGAVGADYTDLTDYGFMYNRDYPAIIFRNVENDANYHSYYDPTNNRIVLTNLTTLAVSYIGGSGSAAWGAITGTLSDQTDLQAALDAKQNNAIVLTPTGTQTTTSNSASSITGLSFSALANKKYYVSGKIRVGCNNTGGVRLQVTLPSDATVNINLFGFSTSTTAYTTSVILSSGTLGGQFCQLNSQFCYVDFFGEIQIDSTAGTVQFGFASVTNTQTSTINEFGSRLIIQEI